MSPARSRPRRREPLRTCVGCRAVQGKRSLVRVVRSTDGILIDPTGRLSGRGAYLHDQRSCWQQALQGSLAKALRVELDEEAKAILKNYMNKLPDEQNG